MNLERQHSRKKGWHVCSRHDLLNAEWSSWITSNRLVGSDQTIFVLAEQHHDFTEVYDYYNYGRGCSNPRYEDSWKSSTTLQMYTIDILQLQGQMYTTHFSIVALMYWIFCPGPLYFRGIKSYVEASFPFWRSFSSTSCSRSKQKKYSMSF